ncbi:MAG: FAD-dependent oxidoreductase [Nocardioides sp.]|uniref:NAD(P)/FAD-dependent oxidoreductase n=1 Tax=Nocardioides sp. TaxID=35761 RepID=UPI0039E4D400
MDHPRIAVVGGSLAGLRAAEQLRASGHVGPVTVYGAEAHAPYNRPPLSKDVLADPATLDAEAALSRLTFRRRSSVGDVDFRFSAEVLGVDLGAGRLAWRSVGGGDPAEGSGDFDGLVVATGLRPRRLSAPGPERGRYVLRTVEDCLELRAAVAEPRRVVVVGAGFIGCEAACTLAALGHDVTVVEPTGAPMNRVLGEQLALAVQRHHERSGIRFVIGPGVTAFEGGDRVSEAVLDDGQRLPVDVVIEAVGSIPNTEWLAGTGLDLADGVLTDNDLAAVGADRVVAVGDLARFPNPIFDDVPRRVEHWSIPTDTAKRAAPTLVALVEGRRPDLPPFAPVPSFWSDQADLRFQSFGSPGLADEVVVAEGDPDDLTAGVLTLHHRAGRHVGTVALNLPPARQRELRDAFVTPTEARN